MKILAKSLLKIHKKGLVLLGHGVTKIKRDDYIERLHLGFERFKETVEFFEELGFEFISMPELIALSQSNFKSDKNWIHLTFDDGYRNNYSVLYPYLREKQIPFSLFISTNHIERNERFYTYKIRCAILNTKKEVHIPGFNQSLFPDASREERIRFCKNVAKIFKTLGKSGSSDFIEYIEALLSFEEWQYFNGLYGQDELLTIDQLKELANDKLVHIGSHNHNHLILNQNISDDEIAYEMETSKNWLQKNLKVNLFTYCYPNGSKNDFSSNSKRICQSLGYELAFTAVQQAVYPNTDKYEIPRVEFPEDDRSLKECLGMSIKKTFLPHRILKMALVR